MPERGEHVVQTPARLVVIVHVSGGHHRQVRRIGHGHEPARARHVAADLVTLEFHVEAAGKQVAISLGASLDAQMLAFEQSIAAPGQDDQAFLPFDQRFEGKPGVAPVFLAEVCFGEQPAQVGVSAR